jgi:hypothetical protein
MKWYQFSVAGLVVLGCLSTTHRVFGAEDHEKSADKGTGNRPAAEKILVSSVFDQVIKILDEKKEGTIKFNLEKASSSDELSDVDLDSKKIIELKKEFEGIKKYAEKLQKCAEGQPKDKISEEMLKGLNEFVTYIEDQKALGTFNKVGSVNEKEINTYVIRVQQALKEKADKFSSTKTSFEKSDKDVQEHLVAIAKLLQQGQWDKKVFHEEKVKEDAALKAIKNAEAETKACVLDEVAAGPGTTDSVTQDNSQPAPPVQDPTVSGGTNQIGGVPPQSQGQFNTPNVVPINPANNQGFSNNQVQELQNQLRNLIDSRDREKELENQLREEQLAQINGNNDQALAALQGALNQAQRPNVSRGSTSDQGPQISPSVAIPPSQQQPFPQMPMQPLPPPQPMPLGPLMNNTPPPPPIMPYAPSRFNDDIPARPAVAQPDPTTTALLQTLQQQNQMFQQMMTNRYPYMGGGVPNVNGSVGGMLQNFGRGPMMGGSSYLMGARSTPSVFRGNSIGGPQGTMSINPRARGPLPSILLRR